MARNWAKILTRAVLVALLVTVIIVPIIVSWSDQRVEMHARWQTQYRLAQTIVLDMRTLSDVVSANGTYASASSVTLSIASSLYNFIYLDWAHANQLDRIRGTVDGLRNNWLSYAIELNSTQRATLSGIIGSIAQDLVQAHSNYVQFTSTGTITGPPFWYNGPSPPDENLLQQAVALASLPGLPTLPL